MSNERLVKTLRDILERLERLEDTQSVIALNQHEQWEFIESVKKELSIRNRALTAKGMGQ